MYRRLFTMLAISSRFSLTANLLKLFLLVIKLLILFYIYGGAFHRSVG